MTKKKKEELTCFYNAIYAKNNNLPLELYNEQLKTEYKEVLDYSVLFLNPKNLYAADPCDLLEELLKKKLSTPHPEYLIVNNKVLERMEGIFGWYYTMLELKSKVLDININYRNFGLKVINIDEILTKIS